MIRPLTAAAPLLALTLLLSACASPEQRAAAAKAQLEADSAECQSLGFKPDTEAFSNCLLKLREIRAEEATAQAQRRANDRYLFGPHWPWYNRRDPYWRY